MRIFKSLIYFFLVSLCIVPVLAQGDDCPTLVQNAITAIGNLCGATGLNQACYGNISIRANPQPGIVSFVFDKPGDVVRVADLKTLRADPFDSVTKQWGVALMRLQANIPDMLPGQMVSFLVFGDVQLDNRAPALPAPLVTFPSNTVLLGAPQSDAPVVGALSAGDQAFELNQSADAAWIRLELNGSDRRTGWVPASLLMPVSGLPIFDANAPAPMQAFSLQTGATGAKCSGVPQDGILVQSPGAGNIKIKLTVNDVNVELGSTVFFQAQPNNMMIISVIEGKATVELRGQIVDVPQGSWVSIPMDANLEPIGTISNPKGYEPGQVDNLPVGLLPQSITVAPPIVATATNLCVSNPNGAWLRAQPSSTNQTILRVLVSGDAVQDSGSTLNDGTQLWRQVVTVDNQLMGWIEATSLSDCANSVQVSSTAPSVVPSCTPRADWTLVYTVRPGNTLAQIARIFRISVIELAQGNCISDVNALVVGQRLRIPKPGTAVTEPPPFQLQQGATSVPAATNAPPPISSGRWSLTITTQQTGCQTPTQSSTFVTIADVQVSANLQFLSFTLGRNTKVGAGATFSFVRTSASVYSGTWGSSGQAVLVVTGANQGTVNATAPCNQIG